MRGRTCTRECKLDVCRQLASGQKRIAQVCREHQVGETVVLRWRQEVAERGEATCTPQLTDAPRGAEQRMAELERVCGQWVGENALLTRELASGRSRSGTP